MFGHGDILARNEAMLVEAEDWLVVLLAGTIGKGPFGLPMDQQTMLVLGPVPEAPHRALGLVVAPVLGLELAAGVERRGKLVSASRAAFGMVGRPGQFQANFLQGHV